MVCKLAVWSSKKKRNKRYFRGSNASLIRMRLKLTHKLQLYLTKQVHFASMIRWQYGRNVSYNAVCLAKFLQSVFYRLNSTADAMKFVFNQFGVGNLNTNWTINFSFSSDYTGLFSIIEIETLSSIRIHLRKVSLWGYPPFPNSHMPSKWERIYSYFSLKLSFHKDVCAGHELYRH